MALVDAVAAVVPHPLILVAPRVQWGSISCAIYAATDASPASLVAYKFCLKY